jgi:glycosyltransferase involved in cell wall biosynthesis
VVRLRNLSLALRARANLSTPLGFPAAARRLIDEHQVEVVHSHEVRTVENLLLAKVLRGRVTPLLVSPHGTLPYDTGRGSMKRIWDRLFGRRVLRRVDHVLALTAREAQQAHALWASLRVPLARDQVGIVPNGVDAAVFERLPDAASYRARWRLGPGPVVLFLGRLSARKGVALLLDAFADAAPAVPGARLLVAGPDEGQLAALRARARAYGLDDRVVFTGLLEGDDRLGALAVADVFALPATGEGFSVAALEAMACARPVVLSPECHFPELAARGAGLEVALTRRDWAAALVALLTDPDRRASMGGHARRLVDDRYAWRVIAARVERVYDAAIRRAGVP